MISVDSSIFIQFLLFLIAYFTMTTFLFKPFLKRHYLRKQITHGHEDESHKLLTEHKEMQYQYEQKVRQISVHLKTVMDEAHLKANKMYDEIIGLARTEAEKEILQAKKQISLEYPKVRSEVLKAVPDLSQMIAKKIMNKEV